MSRSSANAATESGRVNLMQSPSLSLHTFLKRARSAQISNTGAKLFGSTPRLSVAVTDAQGADQQTVARFYVSVGWKPDNDLLTLPLATLEGRLFATSHFLLSRLPVSLVMAASLALQVLAAVLDVLRWSVVESASFTSYGSDSMTALRFVAECKSRGVLVAVDTILLSPSIGHLLQQCRQLNSEAITAPPTRLSMPSIDDGGEENDHGNNTSRCSVTEIGLAEPSTPVDDLRLVSIETEELCDPSVVTREITELSESQISLVHGSMEAPGANIIYYYETYRPDQVSRMKNAWKQILHMEPIFRTIYRSPEDGCLMLPKFHWRQFTTTKTQAYQDALSAGQMGVRPWPNVSAVIDLAVRFTIVHYQGVAPADSRSTLVWSVHHALIDGWSASLLLQKVHLAASGQAVQPGPPYSDLCVALDQLRSSRKAEGDDFWTEQQDKLAAARDEPLIPAASTNSAGSCKEEIRITLGHHHNSIKAAARSCDVTPTTFFHAAWAMWLGLYTDSDNAVTGTVVSGRNHPLPGVLDAIGPMVNTLPLQVDISWSISVRDFVGDVFNRMQHLQRYSWTTPDNGFSRVRGPLLAMQPDAQRWEEGSVGQIGRSFSRQTTNLPLSAVVTDDGSVILQYCSQRYSRSHMETASRVLEELLISLCQTENTLESCASGLLSTTSIATFRSMGNCNSSASTGSSITDDLVTLFERAATKYPSAVAIERVNRKTTYAELERLSGRIARTLAGLITPEGVVAVHADGSIIGDSLFESSTARFFLATTSDALSVKPKTALSALDIESMVDKSGSDSTTCFGLRAEPRPWERAYLCFTSGSTGKPKGVMCTHQGLVAFQRDFEVRLLATIGTRVAQVMSVAFDGSIHELFSAISYGATLVLRQEGEAFGHLKTVDSAILTPSIASVLDPDDFPRLKTVYMVGEAVPQAVCNTWAARKVVYNMYWPTEATCGATIKRLRPNQPVTIGGPNPSTRIYILDHRQRLAPIGRIAGEIVFLGRADRQIKLQGFRVDLEDLEARVLRACDGARAVAITRRGDDLVCMIQTASSDVAGMRATIRKVLPAFAVPRYISAAAKLPMTSTGKVNYRAIADGAADSHQNEENLETETEAIVAAAWSQVLKCGPCDAAIGPRANFTQLGGHSLQQLRLAARHTAVFGEHITVRMIAELPTLRDLAGTIDKMKKGPNSSECQKQGRGQYEPSPMEKEWWQKYQLDRSSSAFNVSYVGQYDPNTVSRKKLIDAWNVVLARHDVFRGRYVQHRRQGLQRIVLNEAATVYHNEPLPPSVQPYYQRVIADAVSPPCYLSFWSEYLRDVKQARPAYLGNGAERTSYRGKSSVARVSASLWRRILDQAAQSGVTLQQLILAAVAAAVSADDSDFDITLGMPFINRQSEADMHAVGLFLEPLPVRVAFTDESPLSSAKDIVDGYSDVALQRTPTSIGSYLAAVQASCQRSLSHAIPWHQLLDHLEIDPQEQLPGHPLFDCVVSFHDARRGAMASTADEREGGPWSMFALGDGVEPQFVWSEGAKFKLMVECMAVDDDTLLLRLEYDTTCFEGTERISAVRRMILHAMDAISSRDTRISFVDLCQELQAMWQTEKASGFAQQVGNRIDANLLEDRKAFFQEKLSKLHTP
ncbi:hypothetical protein EPUS_09263 [Endocarpon pusillum Z07020]|uniref:Carrier domain-containing protein n=1 Tax=Endocarpon pusillum (strain Z07020 / HMAS-L-300199) TaxID=1263415 RepID=U1HS59_ENDPU|nr:uncharacterized protein EPUS_09263 [Endocarpon pusillum Z07020]ERF72004.1 hypothetical protein EPUS_09263 [Endocarpon pusillum Z07020]